MSDEKKALITTISSIIYQIVSVISGFILPKLMLEKYGSEVNGLITTITQYITIISLLDMGVGAVVQSSLYKPLVNNDIEEISKIVNSGKKFFRNLGRILIVYIIVLSFVFPKIVNVNIDNSIIVILIFILSLNYFAQYFFGIINKVIITASQKGYIVYITQSIALIINTIACYLLVVHNYNIISVKLITSISFIVQPIIYYLYVRKNYKIDNTIKYTEEPIKQKWNAVAQHVSAVVLENSDVIMLSSFSDMLNVSIYSVYSMVTKGVRQLFVSFTGGLSSYFGNLWANNNKNSFSKKWFFIEWIMHNLTVLLFIITAITIMPFITIYTIKLNDANYINPLFGLMMTLAMSLYCFRLIYSITIQAVGHYRQTQNNYVIAIVINLLVSFVSVNRYGLIGVTFGTIAALFYQTIWMRNYIKVNIMQNQSSNMLKALFIDTLFCIIMYLLQNVFNTTVANYTEWFGFALINGIISVVVLTLLNILFNREMIRKCFNKEM